ncbi:hypothetical protein AF71_00058800 [Rhizobium sp. 57MFTsu3.2]|nr:hypothetical protein [Rhizobium sp. 57MFTsu3.2]
MMNIVVGRSWTTKEEIDVVLSAGQIGHLKPYHYAYKRGEPAGERQPIWIDADKYVLSARLDPHIIAKDYITSHISKPLFARRLLPALLPAPQLLSRK